jgi:hypothetical protein
LVNTQESIASQYAVINDKDLVGLQRKWFDTFYKQKKVLSQEYPPITWKIKHLSNALKANYNFDFI